MQKTLMKEAEKYASQNHRRRIWRKIVQAMACVVVFCTTYALILPAITMEKNPCDLTEHTHCENCYEKVVSEEAGTLVCTYESLGVHVHTQDCYNGENELICGQADYLIHEHNDDCLDENGTTVCQLPEVSAHEHSDACYSVAETEPAEDIHVHGDGCYATERGEQSCQLTETEGHTHGQSCFTQGELICRLTEQEGHIHGTACYESVLTCELSEEPAHQHTDECYEMCTVLVCGLEEGAVIPTSTEAVEQELICTEPVAQVHIHSEACFMTENVDEDALTCTLPEDENHTHSVLCYGTWKLICTQEEHTHDLVCQNDPEADVETEEEWMATFADVTLNGEWDEDLLAIARSQLGYQESTRNYEVMEDGESIKGYTRYGDWYGYSYGDWCAMFVSFCLNYAEIPQNAIPYEASCPAWVEKLRSEDYDLYRPAGEYTPVPGDLIFFDWTGNGVADHVGIVEEVVEATQTEPAKVKTIEGNSMNEVGRRSYLLNDDVIFGYGQLPEKPDPQVQMIMAMIDGLPTYEELAETLTAYEEAEDMDSYEEYYIWVGQTGLRAYNAYQALTEEQKAQVTNIDRLMELESVWSVATLELSDVVTVFEKNGYWAHYKTLMIYGNSVAGWLGTVNPTPYQWRAIIVEKSFTGKLYVDYVSTGTAHLDNFATWKANTNGGFVLLVCTNYIDVYPELGDEVVVSFDYAHKTQEHEGTNGIGTVSFRTSKKYDKNNASELTIVQGADTSSLIELNLFDYNSAINTRYNANRNYLGFQQDYGTKSIGNSFGSLSFNFGNNITTDLDAGHSDITSENAVGVANRVTRIDGSNLADVPYSGAVQKLLNSDGYPMLASGHSLDTYFFQTNESAGVIKQNTANISGLFLYNETTGAYTFDSRENHAQFDPTTNRFVLYDQLFSPNFIMYPFGNFMPLNDIVHDTVRSDRSDRPYMLEIANSARWKANNGYRSEYATLSNVLYKYVDKMDTLFEEKATRAWTAGNMVQQYFGLAYPNDPNETTQNLNNLLPQIYTLDYDTPSNFYFGMTMRMNLLMPKGGMTGKDTNQDGTPDYPMVFEFAGDDDVWVYIDDVLFLDLGGIHRHVGGEIDFVNGKVYYYAFDSYVDGKIKTTPYKTETFAQILQAAGRSTDVLNEKGTFKDYTSHSFDFFYTERGSGSSVCRINFNFPLLKQNSISVAKELTSTTNVEMVGNKDFEFQILKAGTTEPFILEGTNYTIYDTASNARIGTGTVGQYGFFTLKAGQRAEFTGIDENAGQYYVRERIPNTLVDQYANFYVDGTVVDESKLTSTGSGQFTGVVSPVKDISNGSSVFNYNNHVDASKLSYLTITKIVEGVNAETAKNLEFDMMVQLNGTLNSMDGWTPIPVGTPYTLYRTDVFMSNGQKVKIDDRPDRVVTTEGIVTVPGGATAEIDYMIPGTTWRVYETSGSAEGYTVVYKEFWGTEPWIKAYDNRVEGTIPVYNESNLATAHVCMTVTNTVPSGAVSIPVTKTLSNGSFDPNTPHTYSFKIDLVKRNGNPPSHYNTSYTDTKEVTVTGNNPANFNFAITYLSIDFTGPSTLIYKITENAPDALESTHDTTVYYATVKVNYSGGKITGVNLESIKKDSETGTQVPSATFENTLLGEINVSKVVNGSYGDRNKSFEFFFWLANSNRVGIAGQTVTVIRNGVTQERVTDSGGRVYLSFKHGETVTIQGIPLGSTWRVQEQNYGSYLVSWEATPESCITKTGPDYVEGKLPGAGVAVTFTNTSTYVLPETGGAGTIPYTMAGLVLILFSMAYLMYRPKARGKGES